MKTIEIAKINEIKRVMGNNFFGPADYKKYYKDKLGKFQIPEIPIEPEELIAVCPFYADKRVSRTHQLILLVPKLNNNPLTMMELQRFHPAGKQPKLWKYGGWYKNEKFANTPASEQPVWVLMLNEIILNSVNKTWQAQQELLSKGYDVPSAIRENLKVFFHHLTSGECLNRYRFARTSDIDSDGSHVFFGGFDGINFGVDCWGKWGYTVVGLAAIKDDP